MNNEKGGYIRPINMPDGYELQGYDARGNEIWGPTQEYNRALLARGTRSERERGKRTTPNDIATRAQLLGDLEGVVA